MKGVFLKSPFGIALLLVAAGMAYLLGWSSGQRAADAVTLPTAAAKHPAAAVPASPEAKAPLTRDQILAQWKSSLENPRPGSLAQLEISTNPADVPDLLDALAQWPRSSQRDSLMLRQFVILAMMDPATALTKVDLLADPTVRNQQTGGILGRLLAKDTAQGLDALASLPPGQWAQEIYAHAFQTWAGAHAAAAAATALGLPAGPNQIAAAQGVAQTWAYHDPQAALLWASTLPPADDAALQTALKVAGKYHPDLAAHYADMQGDATQRSQAIQNVSFEMARKDPAGTLTWLNQVATGETYDKSLVNVISWLAANQPGTATTLLAQVTEPGVNEAVIANVSTGNWAQTSPRSVMAWLQTLPESPARNAALQKVAQGTDSKTTP